MRNKLKSRHGISMAETIISTMLVGFVLVSTLQVVGPIVQSTSLHADRLVATNLANELTEEIATRLYTNPDSVSGDSIGVDDSERSAVRADFDDVDDYNGWESSPPKLSTDQSNVFLNGWKRYVKVEHVLVSDASTVSATETGLKRVTVFVMKNKVVHAQIESLHSRTADTVGFVIVN